jgi:hypothetical protein
MRALNSLVLQEFAKRGLSIKEGIAVDARLVKSASRPLSKEGLRESKEKRNTPEGKVDKNGNTLKFSRDAARQFFDKKRFSWGLPRASHKNSKVTILKERKARTTEKLLDTGYWMLDARKARKSFSRRGAPVEYKSKFIPPQ